MKKLLIIIAVAVSGVVNGQDYGDSLVHRDFVSKETVEYWMVRYINEERTKRGLDTLVYDSATNKWITQQIDAGSIGIVDGGTY